MEQRAERRGAGGSAHEGENTPIRQSPVEEKHSKGKTLELKHKKNHYTRKTLEPHKFESLGTGLVTIQDETIWHRSGEET